MKLTKGRIYQIIAIVLLLLSMRYLDAPLYNVWDEEGEMATIDYSDNVLGMTKFKMGDISRLIATYRSYAYLDTEQSNDVARVEMVIKVLPYIKYISIVVIILMALQLSPAWGCIPLIAYIVEGGFLLCNPVREEIESIANYFDVLRSSQEGIMLSVQYIFYLLIAGVAALSYSHAHALLGEEKKKKALEATAGTSVVSEVDLPNEQTCFCVRCGAKQLKTAKYCSKCGSEMNHIENNVSQETD